MKASENSMIFFVVDPSMIYFPLRFSFFAFGTCSFLIHSFYRILARRVMVVAGEVVYLLLIIYAYHHKKYLGVVS